MRNSIQEESNGEKSTEMVFSAIQCDSDSLFGTGIVC